MSPAYQNCSMPVPNANAAGQGSFPGSFLVPGTSTSFAAHGIVFFDMYRDFGVHGQGSGGFGGSGANQFQGPGASAAQLAQHAMNGGTDFDDHPIRPNFETRTPTAYGELKTYIEIDFNDVSGTQNPGNQDIVRLRQGYGTLGPWLMGQTKNLFDDIQVYPDLSDAGLDAGMRASTIVHVPQIRYTYLVGGGILVAGALEMPTKTGAAIFTTGSAVTAITDDDYGAASTTGYVQIPDVAMRVQLDQPWGHVGLNGVVHQINIRNVGNGSFLGGATGGGSGASFKKQTEGYAVGLTGHLNTFGKDRLAGGVEWIRGVADLNTTFTADAIMNGTTGAWDPMTNYSIYGSYEHFFNGQWRANASMGYSKFLNNIGVLPIGQTTAAAGFVRRVFTSHVNAIYSPVPMTDFITEWVHADIQQRSSAGVTDNRLTEQFKFYF
jgi:hypothetical protein